MQFRYFPYLILLLAVFVFVPNHQAHADTPAVHYAPAPKWLLQPKKYDQKIPLRQVENGYFYQLMEEQINVAQSADYHHNIREIVTESGIQNGSQIQVSFDPSYERINFHQITVWRDGKPLNRLNTSAFKMIADEKDLTKFIYQGTYSALLILDDIRKGDKIDFSYTIVGCNPTFGNKFFGDYYFNGGMAIAHQYKAILIPASRKLYIKNFNKVPQMAESVNKGLKSYVWENYQVKPVDDYENTPAWFNPYSYVQVSEYASWKEVADWALSVNPIVTHFDSELADRIAKMKSEAGSDKEAYFRKAVMMVQDEVRYMGIEMGQYSHRANSPDKVYHQRYGDCKDKALLLASVLNAGGIEAHMVLVNADLKGHISDFVPSPDAFDHAVVVAKVNGKEVWADATIAYQRGTGTHLFFPDYGRGLILKEGNSTLTTIRPTQTGKVICQEVFTIKNEKEKVKLDVKTTYTLEQAESMRDRLASESRNDMEKGLLKYYAKTYPGVTSKDSVTIIDDEKKNELTTIEHYQIRHFLRADSTGRKFSATLFAGMVADQLPNIAADAKAPINLEYPYHLDFTTKVVLPGGWNMSPAGNEIKRDAYDFVSRYSAQGDTLSLNYEFKWLKDFLPVNKFDEYRDDVQQINEQELSYGFSYSPDVNGMPFRFNYWMLWMMLGIAAVLSLIALKLYRIETPGILFTRGADFYPLGGWLIVLAIGFSATPVAVIYNMATAGFFDLNRWGLNLFHSTAVYKSMFLFEAIGNTLLVCFSVFCFILLINRRDILPKAATIFYLYGLGFALADYALVAGIQHNPGTNAIYGVLRALVVAAIWIPYFRRSVRVEQTFIVPYPAHNYSYEDAQVEMAEA